MKTTTDYLDLVQMKFGEETRSDNRLAGKLGVTRQAISQYRKGQQMSVGVALKIAAALELDPAEPVCATMYHQSATEEEREFWQHMYLVFCEKRD